MDLLARDPTRTSYLERSFIVQRRGMSVLAALFPVAFLGSSFIIHRTEFQKSISAYYWTNDLERNIFVGVLCAIAVFLVLYKGYNLLEDRILDMAGICAAGIAFFPMDRFGDCTSSGVSAHGVFAVIFFVCIFYECIFMSRKSLSDIADPIRQESFRRAYRFCSGIMIGSVALAVLSRFLPKEYIQDLCKTAPSSGSRQLVSGRLAPTGI